jgi:hypothetical protein
MLNEPEMAIPDPLRNPDHVGKRKGRFTTKSVEAQEDERLRNNRQLCFVYFAPL